MKASMVHRSSPIRTSPSGSAYSSFIKNLIGLAPCLLVSLVLLAPAEFFRVSSQRTEMMAAQSLRAMEAVRATQMLTIRSNVEIEKVRSEADSNFDVLADFIGRTSHQIGIIRDSQTAIPAPSSGTNEALRSYVRRLKAREEYIERFKSGFAIVRNSRRFVPRIGEQLAEAARDGGYGKVEAATRQVLEVVQSFLRRPTRGWRHRMEQAMHMLAENADSTPLRTQAETLNKHVHALLRHHGLAERRFEEVMRMDVEDRATRAIDLLDTDYRQSEVQRRYYDYGFRVSLGLAVFYWSTLIVRWMSWRRQRKTAARAPEVPPAKGTPSPWGMDAALATAGGPGFPLEDTQKPGRAGGQERPVQARRAQGPGRGTSAGGVPGSGRTDPALEKRLKAWDETRRTQREEPGREDARGQGAGATETRNTPAGADESASTSGRASLGLERRLKAEEEIKAQPAQRPEPLPEDVREKKDAVEEAPGNASISPGVRKDLGEARMANVRNNLRKVMGIDGAIGGALVDVNDGLTLATAGGGKEFDFETAGAGYLDVIRSKMKVVEQLGLDDRIEDIQITLGRQYHLIRPLERNSADLFLYVALDRERGNLGMARFQLKGIEANRPGIPED